MSEPERPWTVLNSRLIHDGSPWIKLYQDTIRTGSGRVVEDFHRIEARDFALVFARAADGRIIVLRHWRQGPGRFVFGFAGGHVDPGEDPASAALRELSEETGYAAASVRALGRFCLHSNFGIGWGHFFLAEGVTGAPGRDTDDLETAAVRVLDEADLRAALDDGEVATVHDALCAHLALAAGG